MNAREERGVLVLELAGRLDGNSSPGFGRLLEEKAGGAVVLEMRGLEFISSAGLREFVTLAKRLARSKSKAVLVGATGPIDEVLEISGVGAFFLRAGDVEAAIRLCVEKRGGFLARLFPGASRP
jgi:anti-anti-sigma factor